MTKEDFVELARIARNLPDFERVGVFSPIKEGEKTLFPKATGLPRWKWDLNKPSRKRFDVLLAANVFMYSPDPDRWFRNVLASCNYFIMLDLIRRRRDENSEFGSDKDCMRYGVREERPRTDEFFDLHTLGDRLLSYKTFFGGSNPTDEAPVHVLALIKGDLADPVIRIDDYPTGIRPILPDLSPLHDILLKFESAELTYHLGIVPAILTEKMFQFLERLEYMIPCVHGFDHGYPTYSHILEEKGDIYNKGTVGVFNEFKGQKYDAIREKLSDARRILEDRLSGSATSYIPPCNIGDRMTGRALLDTGFSRYFSEKKIPGCELPWIRSDFYGVSPDFDFGASSQVTTLHTTWEWDVSRRGDTGALDKLIHHLKSEKRKTESRTEKMKALLSEKP